MKSIRPRLWPLEDRLTPSTIIVTTVADAGAGSLRAALAEADALPGKDTIKFKLPAPPANSENIITLTSGELRTKGNVTISGPRSGKLIVSGNAASRVFNINDADSATDSQTTIGGLSIVRGNAGSGYGGGILATESLTLKGVVIAGNYADAGAGVHIDGRSNNADSVTVSNSQIVNNTAATVGGGMDLFGLKSISIGKSTISGNNGGSYGGGGAYLSIDTDGTGISVSGCTVTGNQANFGGGLIVRNYSPISTAKTIIKGCTITGNISTSTAGDGGGGLNLKGGNNSISGSTISNNTSVHNGGGIEVNGFTSLTISKSTITGNRTTSVNAANQGGGGVFIVDIGTATLKPATITGSTISSNTSAYDGGGVLAGKGVNLTISSSKFSSNRADHFGGGLAASGVGVNRVDVSIKGSTFAGNYSAFAGGGISTYNDGKFSITASKVLGNTAYLGGGILAYSTAALNGVVIKNTTISGNVAVDGGGIELEATPDFHITRGSITNNFASGIGGGIRAFNASGSIQGVSIKGNVAKVTGGGIFQQAGGNIAVQVSKVVGNIAPVDPNFSGLFTFI